MKERCLLTCSLGSFLLVFNTAHTHLPAHSASHSGLSPPTPIIKEDNASKSCPQANVIRTMFQVRFLQTTLSYVKLAARRVLKKKRMKKNMGSKMMNKSGWSK